MNENRCATAPLGAASRVEENVDVGDEWLDDFDAINWPEQQKKAPPPKKAAPKRKT
jgi:hypothetical protein